MIQMRRMMAVVVALGFCLTAVEAAAQVNSTQPKPEYITGGVGYFDLKPAEPSSNVQLEWGLGLKYWLFVPESAGSALAPSDRSSISSGGTQGGIGLELSLGDSFIFTPSIAAGVADKGEVRDPTDPNKGQIEIRTGIAAAYEFSNDWRLGATYFHVTNPAQVGTSTGDSGDVLNFTLAVPFGVK